MFSQAGRIAVKGVEGGELADIALRLRERVGGEQERAHDWQTRGAAWAQSRASGAV